MMLIRKHMIDTIRKGGWPLAKRINKVSPCCIILAVAAAVQGADWPQFMGPKGDGTSPEKGLLRAWPEGGPKVLWTRPLGQGFGPAAVRDGKVYVLDRVDEKQDVLRCLDLTTGQEAWTFAYDAPGRNPSEGSRSTPAVTDKYIFIVGSFGHFHCLDRATHQVLWKKHLLTDFGTSKPNWGVAQSPVVYKDMVIVAPQSPSKGVVACDQATGAERWHSPPFAVPNKKGEVKAVMDYSTAKLVTADGQDQFVVLTQKDVRAVSATDGQPLWTYVHPCQIPIPNLSALGNGKFFVTGAYKAGSAVIQVTRQDAKWTIKEIGKTDEIGGHCHPGLVFENHIYVLCNINERADGLVCFDADAKVVWQTKRDPYLCKGGSILTADGIIYLVDGKTGELYIIEPSPAGFKPLSKVKMLAGNTIWAPLALADGRLIIRDQSQMKCLDIRPQ